MYKHGVVACSLLAPQTVAGPAGSNSENATLPTCSVLPGTAVICQRCSSDDFKCQGVIFNYSTTQTSCSYCLAPAAILQPIYF